MQLARTPSPSGSALVGGVDEDSLGPLPGDEERCAVMTGLMSPSGGPVLRTGSWGESPAMGSVASGLTGMSGDVWSLDGMDLAGREPENDAWTLAWLQAAIAAVGVAPKPVLVHDTTGVAACAVALTRAAQQLQVGFSQVLSWGRTLGHDIQEHADLSRAVQRLLDPAAGLSLLELAVGLEFEDTATQKGPSVEASTTRSGLASPNLPSIEEGSNTASFTQDGD